MRVDIKEILRDPIKKRKLFTGVIRFLHWIGSDCRGEITQEQAEDIYDLTFDEKVPVDFPAPVEWTANTDMKFTSHERQRIIMSYKYNRPWVSHRPDIKEVNPDGK